jgi:hypothetical protein
MQYGIQDAGCKTAAIADRGLPTADSLDFIPCGP